DIGIGCWHEEKPLEPMPLTELLQSGNCCGILRPAPTDHLGDTARPARERMVVADQPDGDILAAEAAGERHGAVRAAEDDDTARQCSLLAVRHEITPRSALWMTIRPSFRDSIAFIVGSREQLR